MRASRLLSILLMLQTRGRLTAESLAGDVRGLRAHRLSRHRAAQRRRRAGLCRSRAGRRLPAARRLPHQADRADRERGRDRCSSPACPARRRSSASPTSSCRRSSSSPPPCPSAAAPARRRWRSASISIRSAGSEPDQARLLPTLAHAVWTETVVEIGYRRAQSTVTRRIHPLGLVLKAGTWYVVAERSGERRTYRVSNIEALTPTGDHFTRPKDFDLVRFWTESSRAFEVGLYREQAVLRASPRAMMRLERLGATVMDAAREISRSAGRRRLGADHDPDRIDRPGRDRPADAGHGSRNTEAAGVAPPHRNCSTRDGRN